jgi:hypothetical protein
MIWRGWIMADIEPLIVTSEDGQEVDLTTLVETIVAAREATHERMASGLPNAPTKDHVAGMVLGAQIAIKTLYGKDAANEFSKRVNPTRKYGTFEA